jgi:hypothetical protein
MKSEFLANVIKVLHIIFIIWVVVTPFTNNEPMLVLHLFVVPFMQIHWATNQDTCALTLMERHLRGVSSDESFFHNLVSPVYKIQDQQLRPVIWAASLGLWLVTLNKVMKDPGMIKRTFLPGR